MLMIILALTVGLVLICCLKDVFRGGTRVVVNQGFQPNES